jgi:hypothetical protein
MGEDNQSKIPKTRPTGVGGPPRPPKKTAHGMGDQPPERVPVRIPDPITLKNLAHALARRPAEIVADLMMIEGQITTNVETLMGFDTAAKIVRYYGYEPEKIG